MKTKLTLLVVMLAALAFSQAREPITVTDVSTADSPVALSGKLTLGPEKAMLDVTGQNLSDKGILALVATIEGPPDLSLRSVHDHFFKNMVIAPHSKVEVTGGFEHPFGKERIGNGPWYTPVWDIKRVEAKTIWVQFEDGSTWGDEATGEEVRRERVEAKNFLTHVLEIYQQSGEAAFLKALSASQPRGSTSAVLAHSYRRQQQKQGTTAVVDHIRERLAIGNARTIQ
jgi:hypothetical protein